MSFLTALQKIVQDIMELTDTDMEEESTVHWAKRARTEGNKNQTLRRTGKTFNYFRGELAKPYLRNNSRIYGYRF